ncbi:proto-oncogene vav-like isoform X2 [Synchiropus splendidus]|uniref:proto-oncogene vav-like isoform X2 n=1 Tax=Synchiropus splendidus TaxID=270530 RepID=UPI00237EADA2|nr:proto-oncogene vav-like isoform X2 [Synchiropus splendidus]
MELWRQCAAWLIQCRVLPQNHRVSRPAAQVCDLAQALKDGVLLCQLLNNLLPQAVDLREINLRPQMSQLLCLKNIQMFLRVSQEKFQLKKSQLFDAFDLFDVRDFAKVLDTLSVLSYSAGARRISGVHPFPAEGSRPEDEIYTGLSDLMDDTLDEDHDLCDLMEDEVDEIYEDLMRADELQPAQKVVDRRECCLLEIRQTEEKYSHTLHSILQHFKKPLERYLCHQDLETIFINVQELSHTHQDLLAEIQDSVINNNGRDLYQVFLSYKERLLLYGRYCSQVEAATKRLDHLSLSKEDVRMKLEECSKRANSGRFCLRDLLMVPMQRVLKYHLLLQELMKHTSDAAERENLRAALDAMRDLAQCVNEVKRDNEIVRQITTFQLSIENMTQSLAMFGRPKIDGELKICSSERRSKQDRHAFLFDKAVFICKKRSGDTFELKSTLHLQDYQVRDEPGADGQRKKWSHLFLLLHCRGGCGYDFIFKTRELKNKWLEQFEMALSNMCPPDATANNHDFQMHCFEETAYCRACSMLLRGIFYQGYRCARCKMAAHKECLGRVGACGRGSGLDLAPGGPDSDSPSGLSPADAAAAVSKKNTSRRSAGSFGLPRMEVWQDYCGLPPPPAAVGQPLSLSVGDVVEVTQAEAHMPWWEGRNLMAGQLGWFPSATVQPYMSGPSPDLSSFAWFAGTLDRAASRNLLLSRSDGAFLVRQKDGGEFAISVMFQGDVRHIKVTSSGGLYRINNKKAFKSLADMVHFYQKTSLKECTKDLDLRLSTPYKEAEQSAAPPGGSTQRVSTARARYDFSARDRAELSLREGDTIRILSKKGASGWWKGEVYGRVGLFPANYVDEDYSDYS